MTVKELIEKLRTADGDKEVVVEVDTTYDNYERIISDCTVSVVVDYNSKVVIYADDPLIK